MKLFFSPGACSLSPHIVLRELGLPFDLEKVDLKTKKTKSGVDFATVTAKGAVPTLLLDDGQILTEGAAIVQYLADQKPGSGLAPANGTFERYRLQEWLNYIASELHKAFSPLFKPTTPEEFKATVREQIGAKLGYLQQQLEGKKYLMGDQFTVADAYLFTILQWSRGTGIDLAQWPGVKQYTERVKERPAVKEALETEKAARAAA